MNDIIVKESGGSYSPIPAGAYRAVCYSIVCLGTTFNTAFGYDQKKLLITWELPDERAEIDGESKPRAISETYTLSLNEKSTLRKMLEGWRGKAFTPEELQGFGLAKLLGKPCLLSTIEKQKATGGVFSKASGITRLPAAMPVPDKAENPLVLFDISNPDCPLSDLAKLPEWVQKRIFESNEYKERTARPDSPADYEPVEASDGDLPF